MRATLTDRFWSRVDKDSSPNGCWLWTGRLTERGYGAISVQSKYRRAHRLAYEMLVGEIQAGLVLDHLCRVRNCVNPAHLEAVTQRENVLRGIAPTATNSKKTHCASGHEFTPENTYPKKTGRACRRCAIDKSVERNRGLSPKQVPCPNCGKAINAKNKARHLKVCELAWNEAD